MLTAEEIQKLADREWEPFPGATETDEMVWKNGFMNGYINCQMDQIHTKLQAADNKLAEIHSKLIENQKDLPVEYAQIISENFNDLV